MTCRDGFPGLSARSARRGDAVRNARNAAGPVASATRRRTSKTLEDTPASPTDFLLLGGTLRQSL